MLAATAVATNKEDPLSGLEVGQRPEPEAPPGWATVQVKASALNHHDLWALRGRGLREDQLPMILGCDAAGLDEDGNEVIVHAVISDPDWGEDETLDRSRTLLSEHHQGTMTERVVVPRRNLVPKPAELSFAEAACLPTAWLTAYRMLFTRGGVQPGMTVLVQGVGGGVATAAIALGHAAGARVWATSRSDDKAARGLELGADQVFGSGERLPEHVDVVLDTVGQATWAHSVRSLRPGGTLVTGGGTSGDDIDQAHLVRIYYLQLTIVGSIMGTRDELERLSRMLVATGVRPVIDSTRPLADAAQGFQAMAEGDVFGKIVFEA